MQQMISSSVRRKMPTGVFASPETILSVWPSTAGRLRLVRKSNVIHCLYAESGSDDFKLTQSFVVGSIPVKGFKIEAKTSDEIGQVDVTLEKITLTLPNP